MNSIGTSTDPQQQKRSALHSFFVVGDPYGNRTHVTAVKGPCLNRLTNGPLFHRDCGGIFKMVAGIGLEPMTYRV